MINLIIKIIEQYLGYNKTQIFMQFSFPLRFKVVKLDNGISIENGNWDDETNSWDFEYEYPEDMNLNTAEDIVSKFSKYNFLYILEKE